MRRAALLSAMCLTGAVALTGVGCKVVTGQHDCTYDPSAANLPAPDGRPMFPVVGGQVAPAVVASPPVVAAPVPNLPATLPAVEKK